MKVLVALLARCAAAPTARQEAVLAFMRGEVARAGDAHPFGDPALRLGPREVLVAVHNGSVIVDEGVPEVSCTMKCRLFVRQFRSFVREARRGRCGGGRAALPDAAFLFREASVGCDAARCDAAPTLVVAKAPWRWNATRGILGPNP